MLTKFVMGNTPVKREGNLLAVYTNNTATLRIFDRVGDSLVQYQAVSHTGTNIGTVYYSQFSHDGNYVAVSSSTGLALFALQPDGVWVFRNFVANSAFNLSPYNKISWDFTNQYVLVGRESNGQTPGTLILFKIISGNLSLVSSTTFPSGVTEAFYSSVSTYSDTPQFSPDNKWICFSGGSFSFDAATGTVGAKETVIRGNVSVGQPLTFIDSQNVFLDANPGIFRAGAVTKISNIFPAPATPRFISKSGNYALSSSGLLRKVGKTFQTLNSSYQFNSFGSSPTIYRMVMDVNDQYIYYSNGSTFYFLKFDSNANTITSLSVPATIASEQNLTIYPCPFVVPVITESSRSSRYFIDHFSGGDIYELDDAFLSKRNYGNNSGLPLLGSKYATSSTSIFRSSFCHTEDMNYVFSCDSGSTNSPTALFIHKRSTVVPNEVRYASLGTSQQVINQSVAENPGASIDGVYIAVPGTSGTIFMFKRTGDSVTNLTGVTYTSGLSGVPIFWRADSSGFLFAAPAGFLGFVQRSGDSFSLQVSASVTSESCFDVSPNGQYILGLSGRLYYYNSAANPPTITITPGAATKLTPPSIGSFSGRNGLSSVAWNALGTHVAISGVTETRIYRFNSADFNNLSFTLIATIANPNYPNSTSRDTVFAKAVRFTSDNNYIVVTTYVNNSNNFHSWLIEWSQATETATLTAYNSFNYPTILRPSSIYGLTANSFIDFSVVGSVQSPYLSFYTSTTTGMTKLAGQPNIAPTSAVRDVVLFDGGDKALVASDTEKLSIYSRSGSTFTRMENVFGGNAPTHTVTSIAGSFGGTQFFTNANAAPYLRMYQENTPEVYSPISVTQQPPGIVNKVLLNNAGDILLVGSTAHPFITHYNTYSGGLTKQNDFVSPPTGAVTQMCFSGDDQYMVASFANDHKMNIYKRGSGSDFVLLVNADTPPNGNITALCMNYDGSLLLVGTDAAPFLTLYIRNIESFVKQGTFAQTPTGTVTDVTFAGTSDSQLFATSATSPYLHQYLRSGNTFSKVVDPNLLPGANATSISFSRKF